MLVLVLILFLVGARIFRTYTIFTFSNASWNYGGNQTYSGHAIHAEGQLRNYWSGHVRATWYPGSMDDRLTRGGPLSRFPAAGNVSLQIDSDSRRSTTFGASAKAAWDEAGGNPLDQPVPGDPSRPRRPDLA